MYIKLIYMYPSLLHCCHSPYVTGMPVWKKVSISFISGI